MIRWSALTRLAAWSRLKLPRRKSYRCPTLVGNWVKVTDARGRGLAFTYQAGKLTAVALPDGGQLLYGYDASARLSDVKIKGADNVERQVARYGYTNPGYPQLLTQRFDENDSIFATWEYDISKRVVRSVHGNPTGAVEQTTFAYTSSGTTVTDANGHSDVIAPAILFGRAKAVSFSQACPACNGATFASRTYDGSGYPDVQVDFNGNQTDSDYTPEGLVVRKVDAVGSTSGAKRTVETSWHATFRKPVQRETFDAANALKQRATWNYNARGQVLTYSVVEPALGSSRTATTSYCEQPGIDVGACPLLGLITSVDGARTDAADTTTYTYYPSDDTTCATAPTTCPHRKGDLWKVTNAQGQVTETLRYDGGGRVLSVKDPNGVITDFEYHSRGWLTASKVRGPDDAVETDDAITRIAYWPTGLVQRVTQPDGAFTHYTYDQAHRLTDITDNAGNTIHYTLDNASNRIAEETKDAGGALKRSLSRVYNQLGQLATQADAQAHPTDFTYDANGNLNTVTDALGRVTDNDHDPLNRLARTLQDVGGIAAETKFQYDALDNLTKVTDPKGLDTSYTYNGLGDLTRLHSPDTGTTTYTYDSAGNRASQTDARGVTTTYAYDVLNRLTAVNYPDTALNVSYTYDSVPTVCEAGETFGVGRLSGLDDASGSTRYCYNRFGHLVRKVQTTNGVSFVVRYAYTLVGNLQAMVYPDGTTVDYGRNAQGQVTEVGVTRSGQPRQVLLNQATYHPFGPVAGWTFGNGRTLSRTVDQDYRPLTIEDPNTGGLSLGFGYDAVGNLTKLGTAQGVANPAIRFGYDALGRLTRTEDGPTQAAIDVYAYDATGNRTAHTTAAGTAAYSYPTTSHRLMDVAGVPRSYDAMGNTTAIGGARGFAYNDANRMSLVQQAGVTTRQYAYNGRGEQVRRYLGTASTYTVYDEAGHWLGDYDDTGTPVQQALWINNLPVGLLANGQQLHYLQPDHLGSPRVVIEAARNVPVWTWDLKGEAFGSTAPQKTEWRWHPLVLDMRFPGQRYDTASMLNYNYFRDYDSGSGRYVESDPIGLQGGGTTYSYAFSSPFNYLDSAGLRPVTMPFPWWGDVPVKAAGTVCSVPLMVAIGVGAVLMAIPNTTSACDTLDKPISCNEGNEDCERLALQIAAHVAGMKKKWNELATDPRNLYNLAKYSNPGGDLAGYGTWNGHVIRYEGLRFGLRGLIEQAQRKGCAIPPDDRNALQAGTAFSLSIVKMSNNWEKLAEKIVLELRFLERQGLRDIKTEVQDGGQFILVTAKLETDVDSELVRSIGEGAKKILDQILPSRYGEYSWMLVISNNKEIVGTVFSDLLV